MNSTARPIHENTISLTLESFREFKYITAGKVTNATLFCNVLALAIVDQKFLDSLNHESIIKMETPQGKVLSMGMNTLFESLAGNIPNSAPLYLRDTFVNTFPQHFEILSRRLREHMNVSRASIGKTLVDIDSCVTPWVME
jgi:hypothetical protein